MSRDTKTPLTKSNFLVEAYFGKKKKKSHNLAQLQV